MKTVKSHFQDRTVSWVRIVNGVDEYVTESMPTAKEENTASGKPIAEARPRQKPALTLTSISIPVLERIRIDIETQRSHDQECFEVSKAVTRLLRHDQTVHRDIDGAFQSKDIIEECRKKKVDGASQLPLEEWISNVEKGGGAKKRFQYCLNPNSSNTSCTFEQLGENAIDPALQDNDVLLPKGFTQCIFHVGNASELNSIIRNELIPGGKSIKRARQAVFFTSVNPMEDGNRMEETPRDLTITKPRIVPFKNSWKRNQNIVYCCNLKLAQERGLQFSQTQSHAVVLHNTLPAVCIEKAVCMKTQDELYHKVRLTPRVPRVVLKSNSQYGPPDPQSQEGRSSWDPSSDSKSYGNAAATFWIPEFLESLFLQSSSRTQHVRTRSRSWLRSSRFTRTKNPSLMTWARRRRSTSSAKNHRIYSLTWTTQRSSNFAKIHPNSNVLSAIPTGESGSSIADVEEIWRLRRVQRSSNRKTVTSPQSLAMLSRRTAVVEPSTDLYYQAKQRLNKARQRKHGRRPTILSRWYASELYRNSLYDIGWREKHNVVRQKRLGEARLRRYRSWKNSKSEALDSHNKCRRTSATTQSTTLLCSSEKRVQTMAWRTPGKNHPSQSANKTAKGATIRRNRRIRLRSWP